MPPTILVAPVDLEPGQGCFQNGAAENLETLSEKGICPARPGCPGQKRCMWRNEMVLLGMQHFQGYFRRSIHKFQQGGGGAGRMPVSLLPILQGSDIHLYQFGKFAL